jgi:hypothetical protein
VHQQNVQFVTTMAIINAIIYAGNNIVASNSEANSSGGAEHLKKVISLMTDLLLPKDDRETQKRADQVKELLEKEINKGPIKVRPMARSVKQRGKVTLRRKDGTDSE